MRKFRRFMLGEVQQRVAVALLVLSATGIVTIANREVFMSKPYRDGAGVLTNGYGNTHNIDPTKAITPERALLDLLKNASDEAAAVRACVKVELYQYEFDTYVLLAHNVGGGAFCKSSGDPKAPRLVDLINARRYQDACDRILEFNKVRNPKTGQLEVSEGLTNARAKDRLRCLGKDVA
jgi:lysozyme